MRLNLRWLCVAAGLIAFIVVPYLIWGPALEPWATAAVADAKGRPEIGAALVVGLLAADVIIPVPSSVLSVFAGTVFDWPVAAALVWSGMTLGCVLGYALGATAGRGVARALLGDAELNRARRISGTVGPAMLVVARAVPVLAEASTLAAGASGMRFRTFLIATAAANAAVAASYTAVGAAAAASGSFLILFVGLVLIPAVAYSIVRLMRQRTTGSAQ